MTAYFQTLRILLRREKMLLGTLVLKVGKLGQGVHLISHAHVYHLQYAVHCSRDPRCWPSHLLGTVGPVTEREVLAEGYSSLAEPCPCCLLLPSRTGSLWCCRVLGSHYLGPPFTGLDVSGRLRLPLTGPTAAVRNCGDPKSFFLFPRQYCLLTLS